MAALGVDRWAALTFPLTYASRVRHKHAALTAAYAWVHSLALSTVPTLFAWTDYSSVYASCTVHLQQMEPGFALFTVGFHCASFALTLLVLSVTYMKVLIVARFHCKRIDVITVQTLLVLVDIHPRLAGSSVRINPHWGVISKCLVYSKAAMDPFVYSLLRQDCRKAIIGMTNTLMGPKRSYYFEYNSTTYTENDHKVSW